MRDEEIRAIAKRRVEFKDHLVIYIIINTFLVIINLWFSPMFYWFPFVMIFWGIGLVLHWRDAYMGTEEGRVEREFQKLKKQQKK